MLKCSGHQSLSTSHSVCVCVHVRSIAWSLTGTYHTSASLGSSCRLSERRQIEGFDKWRQHCLDGRCRDCDRVRVPGVLTHSVGWGTSLVGWGMVGENQRHPPVRGREIFKLYYQSGKWNADREQRPAFRLSLLLLEGLGFIFLFLSDLVPVVAQVFKTIKEKKKTVGLFWFMSAALGSLQSSGLKWVDL